MIRSWTLAAVLGCWLVSPAYLTSTRAADETLAPPNILWLTSEDNGPQLGCYGDEYADTPHLDQLASRSLRYQKCWSNAPVCAPARTTLISGMYATSLGGQHMRSGVKVPDGFQFYPDVLREAGYYCTNNSKTDYNFVKGLGKGGWHQCDGKAHFRNRPRKDQPFFAIFNFTISHESKIRNEHTLVHDPDKAPVPAYHPNVPKVRRDWAQYYDRLTEMDAMCGRILKQLDEDGLTDSTIVFYYGDHGSGMPRSKRWPFNSGLHVPFLLHVPEKYKHLAPQDYASGGVTERLVSFVDMGPTAISLAGADVPDSMQGVPFAGPLNGESKELLFGYRGRMDERVDMVRSCTDGRFVYLRHFHPERIYFAYLDYMFQTPTTQVWKEMYDAGELNEAQSKVWEVKPLEELFDLRSDPDEVNNLANDPAHADKLRELRNATRNWMVSTRDLGVLPEAELHRLSGKQDPRTWALNSDLNWEKLVNIAWRATAAWNDLPDTAVQRLERVTQRPSSIDRYWGVRALALGLTSPNTDLSDETKAKALSILEKSAADDEAPIVRAAAAEGLLVAGNDQQRDQAQALLLDLSNADNEGHYVAMTALNLIDNHRDQLSDGWQTQLGKLPRKTKLSPERADSYVGRLLQYLTAD
ncbi:sulfatase-like hydrolase/transferase [Rhodopirellula halodulae]|uniref:sulfatase-like hydrolase/transferase n=1 Tax=Rhodopirellula halodulae TaxID=2894198 RepID=UPI001E51981B|nr:sulfatase-like hydrolase/transferase [Rhodopirellula sp. JC737]MCC9656545.1 sulfatase [Rhodopirellula sp. JC737]